MNGPNFNLASVEPMRSLKCTSLVRLLLANKKKIILNVKYGMFDQIPIGFNPEYRHF